MTRFCPKCGAQALSDQSDFCNKCGTRLPKTPENLVKCPKCGAPRIDSESAFCSRCGTSFSQTPVQPVIVPAKSPPLKTQISPQQSDNFVKPPTVARTCPECGASETDENRFYCRQCGAYLRNKSSSTNNPEKKSNSNAKTSPQNSNKGTKSQNPYSINIILILLFGLGLISVFYPPLLVLIVIISAIAVYYDAKAIGAGGQSQNGSMNNEESTFSTYTWSPLSWGLIVLLLWIIGLPLYLIKRKKLFTLNINGSNPAGVTRSVYPDTLYKASLGNSYESGRALTTEFVLGILGGIIGFVAGFAAIGIGGIGSVFGAANAGTVILGGAGAIVFSILGIIGAAIVNRHTKAAGYLMIISAICGLICISLFYVLSFILLIIAGILAVKNAPPSPMGSTYGGQSKSKSGSVLATIGKALLILFIILIVAVVASVFVFGVTGKTSSTAVVSPREETSPTLNPYSASSYSATIVPTVPAESSLSMGQTATSSVSQVTVYSAQRTDSYTYSSSISGYTPTESATSGNTFIIVDAQVRNTGSNEIYASASDFSLSDPEGNRYDPQMYLGNDGLGYLQELFKNQQKRGKVLFQVPSTATNLILYYNFGNVISGPQLASWTIT